GLISVAGNEIPALMKEMVSSALNGRFDRARAVHERVLPLMLGNFIESNPAPAKAVMKMMGLLETDHVRSPLAPLTEANRTKLRAILEQSGLSAR
ncbi:MAG: dihydrodipicolinate synthase family protein, partial [Thermoanaerobaculia bacterium]